MVMSVLRGTVAILPQGFVLYRTLVQGVHIAEQRHLIQKDPPSAATQIIVGA